MGDSGFNPRREFDNAVRQARRGLNEAATIADIDLHDNDRTRAVLATRTIITRIQNGDIDPGFLSALESAEDARSNAPEFSA